MQHSLAAIRAGRPRTRFAVARDRLGRPRLGLGRRVFEPVLEQAGSARGRPLDELRRATRACLATPRPRRPLARHGLTGRGAAVRWNGQPEGVLSHARPRSAAPWRA